MARCGCSNPEALEGLCNCALTAAPGSLVSVAGTGQPGDPYVIGLTATPSIGFIGQQRFTTVGADFFDPSVFPGARWFHVTCVGGGGGGCGAYGASSARGGGSGANMAQSWLLAASVVGSQAITVGAGGVGGPGNASNDPGDPGGPSIFGSAVVLAGGGNGAGADNPAGTGVLIENGAPPSSVGIGDLVVLGEYGGSGFQVATGAGQGGKGGNAAGGWGFGSPGGIASGGSGQTGRIGTRYGAGGSGAASVSTVGQQGGNGSGGIIIVDAWG